ncbi:unnamed protein product [Chrysoparadoxa australica]
MRVNRVSSQMSKTIIILSLSKIVAAFTPLATTSTFPTSSLWSAREEELQPLSNKDDHLVSVLSGNGEVLVRAITARELVQEALVKQDLRPVAADALGRVMICTLLMSQGLKDKETLQLTFSGSGPLKSVMAISDGEGGVRGFVGNGREELTTTNVGEAIGAGLLQVVRNHPDFERPYNGIVQLRNGQVAYDVAGYLKDSEQKSCAIAAGVTVTGALCRQASGYYIETLPGASDETMNRITANVARVLAQSKDPAQLMADGLTPTALVEVLLEGVGGINSLTMSKPKYVCHCSSERVFRALRLLGEEEVKQIVASNEMVEVKCEFCGKCYRMQVRSCPAPFILSDN